MLSERLLQFIWQFQYFNKTSLKTVSGNSLEIIHPGVFNTNQGPDFSGAKIKTGDMLWAGNVEVHIRASDWRTHRHEKDAHYTNIILHVVWLYDAEVKDKKGFVLPVLEMQPLVSALMLEHYNHLMQSQGFIPCEKYLPVLSSVAWHSWKERLATERLQKRADKILEDVCQSNTHWEEVMWRMLARNFGIVVNAEPFEQLARSIPVKLLARHKNQIHHLEALLLGQAGLLSGEFAEEYARLLQREYSFLKKKYSLAGIGAAPLFLRMRPSNFPTVRLAQLAKLVSDSEHLFAAIKDAETTEELAALLNVTANDYWHYHYRLNEPAGYKPKILGEQMKVNIITNTIIPLVFAYGLYRKEQLYKDKAVAWLLALEPEANRITKQWIATGVENKSALHSQALLELKKSYCDAKRCLDCAIGNKILKTSTAAVGLSKMPTLL